MSKLWETVKDMEAWHTAVHGFAKSWTHLQFSSVQFSRSVVSNSLRPNGLQHIRLPCPSLSPRVCSYSCPLSQWYYLTISSSAALFSSCPQSFLAPGYFPLSWLCTLGGQTIGVSASVLPMSILGWFPLGSTGLISFNPYRKCIMIICPECWIMLITPFK